VGDEQIAWAVDYVGRRMSDVALMLESALHGLDLVVSGAPPDRLSLQADQSVTLVLQTEGSALAVR
jgi:hypothetical protein